jgi:peptide-methionine (S)-S-oxide reductase
MNIPEMETATLGGGCFWCLEAVYLESARRVSRWSRAIWAATSPAPTYEEVCGGDTGHAEVVRVDLRSAPSITLSATSSRSFSRSTIRPR